MPILENPFYHASIETYTAIFGTVFNNIKIVRADGKTIKVPLAYSSKQRYDRKEKVERDAKIKARFPRMGFVLTGWEKDKTRKKNSLNRIKDCNGDASTGDIKTQYNPVPYKFFYDLHIQTRNLKDFLQIIEQIVVYFDDSVEIVVEDNADLGKKTNVRIVLLSDSFTDQFVGAFEDEKEISTTLSFSLDGYLYKPTIDSKTITSINLNFFDMNSEELDDSVTITE